MNKEYEKALEASNKAYAEYDVIRIAYRAKKIDDAEFLAGKAAYDEAGRIFDVAFAKESNGEYGIGG